MNTSEIQSIISECGWKPSQLVRVLQNMKIKQADKRRVSDVINLRRTIPELQDAIAKIIMIDAEILWGDNYWQALSKDNHGCPVCGKGNGK